MEAATWEPSENIEAGLRRLMSVRVNYNQHCSLLVNLMIQAPLENVVRPYATALYTESTKSLKADCLNHTVIK